MKHYLDCQLRYSASVFFSISLSQHVLNLEGAVNPCNNVVQNQALSDAEKSPREACHDEEGGACVGEDQSDQVETDYAQRKHKQHLRVHSLEKNRRNYLT